MEYLSEFQARELALEHARTATAHPLRDEDLIAAEFMRADHCWFFFQAEPLAKELTSPLRDWAVAVSDRGSVRIIADMRDDPAKIAAYLQMMSHYFYFMDTFVHKKASVETKHIAVHR